MARHFRERCQRQEMRTKTFVPQVCIHTFSSIAKSLTATILNDSDTFFEDKHNLPVLIKSFMSCELTRDRTKLVTSIVIHASSTPAKYQESVQHGHR
jgi:hypothetical protein